MEVTKGLVAQSNTKTPQLIRVTASTSDVSTAGADLVWQNVSNDGSASDPFATCRIFYGNTEHWLLSWAPLTHLIQGRIDALEELAKRGVANRFSHNMAYTLFAHNLVDYADKYRGMQTVVMDGFEAYADVTLKQIHSSDVYTVPPFFIDSVAHLAGFIMNVSDASDTAKTFCVTPGWKSMRFARPLIAGQSYRSYVKMIPTTEDPTVYLGDVYILQEGVIIGLVHGIQFRRYPRILLNRFFSAPDSAVAKSHAASDAANPPKAMRSEPPQPKPKPAQPAQSTQAKVVAPPSAEVKAVPEKVPAASAPVADDQDSTAHRALVLIAKEAGLNLADLTDDAEFTNIGVDSLMSLVIAEKFREELGVSVAGSLFLEYPTIGVLKAWLLEYHS